MLINNAQTPLYIQLKDSIKDKITNEKYKLNDKIPTEIELSEIYGVSRITVRKAVKELVEEGYLVKKQGKGTFVSHKKLNRKIEYVAGFTDSCIQNGFKSSSRILQRKVIKASDELKNKLRLSAGEEVIYIQRKRYADNIPVMIENNFFAADSFAYLLNESLEGSLYKLLKETHDIDAVNPGETTLELVMSDEKTSNILELPIGTPLFFMDTIIYDQNFIPIHAGHQYYLGDFYKFSI